MNYNCGVLAAGGGTPIRSEIHFNIITIPPNVMSSSSLLQVRCLLRYEKFEYTRYRLRERPSNILQLVPLVPLYITAWPFLDRFSKRRPSLGASGACARAVTATSQFSSEMATENNKRRSSPPHISTSPCRNAKWKT